MRWAMMLNGMAGVAKCDSTDISSRGMSFRSVNRDVRWDLTLMGVREGHWVLKLDYSRHFVSSLDGILVVFICLPVQPIQSTFRLQSSIDTKLSWVNFWSNSLGNPRKYSFKNPWSNYFGNTWKNPWRISGGIPGNFLKKFHCNFCRNSSKIHRRIFLELQEESQKEIPGKSLVKFFGNSWKNSFNIPRAILQEFLGNCIRRSIGIAWRITLEFQAIPGGISRESSRDCLGIPRDFLGIPWRNSLVIPAGIPWESPEELFRKPWKKYVEEFLINP